MKPIKHYVTVREPVMSGSILTDGMTIWVNEHQPHLLCVGAYDQGDYICFDYHMSLVFSQMIIGYAGHLREEPDEEVA